MDSRNPELQLKIAKMNVEAVTKKLSQYDNVLNEQNKRISELTSKLLQMEERVNKYMSLSILAEKFGSGPTK